MKQMQKELAAATTAAGALAALVEDRRRRGLEHEARVALGNAKTAALAKLLQLLDNHPRMFGHDPARGLPSVLYEHLRSFLPLLEGVEPGATVALFAWLTVNQVGLRRGGVDWRGRASRETRAHPSSGGGRRRRLYPGCPSSPAPLARPAQHVAQRAACLYLLPVHAGHAAEQQGRGQRLRHRVPRHLHGLRGALRRQGCVALHGAVPEQ